MKHTLFILLIFLSCNTFAECRWSEKRPIRNNDKLFFQVCHDNKSIKINETEVKPNISFELIYPDCPECNSIWSTLSPDKKTAVVYIENTNYQRNAWVVDLISGSIELFTDVSEGKHFIVKFNSNSKFTISHAGMGYRTDYHYSKTNGVWRNTGREEIDIER